MRFDIMTLFPEAVAPMLNASILGRAQKKGLIEIHTHQIRDYTANRQPEEVFYFPKPLTLRARWEVEQDWDVRGIPLNKQKPEAITKQKPDADKKIKQRNAERERNR